MGLKPRPVDLEILLATANGEYHSPHDILGAHPVGDSVTIRTVQHLAKEVTVLTPDGEYAAAHEAQGIWVAVLPGNIIPDYRLRVKFGDLTIIRDDPYRFLPTLGNLDLHLFGEGRHQELWNALGAHVHEYDSEMGAVSGVSFTLWAPNAKAVRVIGDFNYWDGTASSMRTLGTSGIWELFIPGASVGNRYKFEILDAHGNWIQKADPMARATEIPPLTASVVTKATHKWQDQNWLDTRSQRQSLTQPISVYEMHLGSWKEGLNYRELAEQLIPYVKALGYTHVEFMPVMEHPYPPSWGYQITSYYAPTSRFGTPDDFKYLIDQLHQADIGVILDWVPAHFPRDEWALANFDGTPLYEDPDPLRGQQPDWGTLVFNYARNEVRNFLVANALYWIEEFHADGLRVDAVAAMLYLDYSRPAGQWRPNQYGGRENLEAIQFLQEVNTVVLQRHPDALMIAEESTAWPGVTSPVSEGGLGFSLKWNMGWMNDTLRYLHEDPVNRRWHHGKITFSIEYAFSENYVLPLSHDEVVHGKHSLLAKMPGDRWKQLATLRSLYAYQWSHPGKKLLFMGQELALPSEWSESHSLDWWLLDYPEHSHITDLVRHLNHIYAHLPALWNDKHSGFKWIEAKDADRNILAYLRRGKNAHNETEYLVCVVNFAGIPHENYRLGLPVGGQWVEILNTDASKFGGSNIVNPEILTTQDQAEHGYDHSVQLRVPPLGVVWLKPLSADTQTADGCAASACAASRALENPVSWLQLAPIPSSQQTSKEQNSTDTEDPGASYNG